MTNPIAPAGSLVFQGGGGSGVVGSPTAVARKTYNAADFPGSTSETRITAMNVAAHAAGASYGSIPEAFLPYDETLVTYFSDVQLGVENGVYQKGVYDARAYGGLVNAGRAIAKCLTNLPSAGGTVDCRGFVGAQIIDADLFAALTVEKPIVLLWGEATWTIGKSLTGDAGMGSILPSYVTMVLNGTTFVAKDGDLMAAIFSTRRSSGIISVTNGSTTATLVSGPFANRGPLPVPVAKDKLVHIRYHKPRGGRDNTVLTAALQSADSVVTVASTTGFPTSGDLLIDGEIVRYTGVTATQFTGLTRGLDGTTIPASHSNGADVDRPVYDSYRVVAVSGSTVTLDVPYAGPTATGASYLVGVDKVTFRGTGTIDGSKPGVNSVNNLAGIYSDTSRRIRVEAGIRIVNCDHAGVQLSACNDSYVDGTYEDIGWPLEHLGFGIVGFANCKRNTFRGKFYRCARAVVVDDRTTGPSTFDNPSENNDIQPSVIVDCDAGVMLEGSNGNYVNAPVVVNWAQHCVSITNPQWITPGTVQDNTVVVGFATPAAGCIELTASAHQNNTLIARHPQATLSGTLDDGVHIIGGTLTVKVGGVVRLSLPASGTITFGDGVAVTGAITATGTIGVIGGVGATLGGGGQAKLNLDGVDATFAAGEMGIGEQGGNLAYSARGPHLFKNATDGLTYASISNAGVLSVVSAYQRGGVQVVAARKTGYTNLMTGVANRATTYDTATITLQQLAERIKALEDDLHSTAGHGLIGP